MRTYRYASRQRSARYMAFFILLIIGVGLMVGLYFVKTRAQNAKSQVSKLESELAKETSLVNVLHAEIAYLENPDRLSDLAEKQLGLTPIAAEQIIAADDISEHFRLIDKPQNAAPQRSGPLRPAPDRVSGEQP